MGEGRNGGGEGVEKGRAGEKGRYLWGCITMMAKGTAAFVCAVCCVCIWCECAIISGHSHTHLRANGIITF